ncbi:MAG: homoserine dehydrogenase [Rhizomicrobium sp.]
MTDPKTLRLALVGYGGVGRALAELLHAREKTQGNRFCVVGVTDLRFGSAFAPAGLSLSALAAMGSESGALNGLPGASRIDNEALAASDVVDVLVEASFTDVVDGEPALSLCAMALAAGKSVATTNKGPVTFGLARLDALAKARGVLFRFEGAVMSGTPVLRTVRTCFPGARFTGFRGILNGTSNYVLGRMEAGASLQDAVIEAQAAGYAEADPTADLEGHDVRLKVAILANSLLGTDIRPSDIPCRGIGAIDAQAVRSAPASGLRWKLIGQAGWDEDGALRASVETMLLPLADPLAAVTGATNALSVMSEPLGATTIIGPGAGRVETAYALLSDLIEIAGSMS